MAVVRQRQPDRHGDVKSMRGCDGAVHVPLHTEIMAAALEGEVYVPFFSQR
jgi:hypothetical protein